MNNKFKYSAIVNEPFNLEIFANDLRPDAIFEKVELQNYKQEVVYTFTQQPIYDPVKKIFYIENVVIDRPGNYWDYWYFINGVNRVVKKSYFFVKTGNLTSPYFYFYARIYNVNFLSLDEIKVVINTNDPYFTIEDKDDVEIRDDSLNILEIDWIHEIGPKEYLIKLKYQVDPYKSYYSITIKGKGYFNTYNLSQTIRITNRFIYSEK